MASRIPRFDTTNNIRDSPKTDDEKRVALILNKNKDKKSKLCKKTLSSVKQLEEKLESKLDTAKGRTREIKNKKPTSSGVLSSSTAKVSTVSKPTIDKQCKTLNRSKTEPAIKTETIPNRRYAKKMSSEAIEPKKKVTLTRENKKIEHGARQRAFSNPSKYQAPKNVEAKRENTQIKLKRKPVAQRNDPSTFEVKTSKPTYDMMCKKLNRSKTESVINLEKIPKHGNVKHAALKVIEPKKNVTRAGEKKTEPAVLPKTHSNPPMDRAPKGEGAKGPNRKAVAVRNNPASLELKKAVLSKPTLDQLCKKT